MLMAGESGVRIPARGRDFFSSPNVHTERVARTVSSSVSAGILSGVKAAGLYVDHSYPFGAETRKDWRHIYDLYMRSW